ncbi:hypothetical protein Q0601_19965 [Paracoccus onubensis]|uniref:hypothetical protein n=1 Tax=Paracoccus onubensis TaxID=1675788 RepID=UPI002731A755|nr:hypothetical protein [Paracoccus onubensis]MDP0929467.1 hypothetical protein [Paracoccus onubensis]
MSPAFIALAVAAFAIDTAEFVMIGLVPEVARDLTVTIPQAGLLVTNPHVSGRSQLGAYGIRRSCGGRECGRGPA